ncbi:ATP-binding protein [Caballeronia sp. LZ034LL]|nr:ATP-binding protein [Caballeronia sp. LZ034LL]
MITVDTVGDSYFRVAVTDSGAGLSLDARQHLFEPFFTTEPEGIGLGLSICRSIVQEHDGMIGTEDREEGARFYFDLPRCAVREAAH